MMACTEMLTMCLLSAKHAHNLQSKQPPPPPLPKQPPQPVHPGTGPSIFHDIFRRADKNDDGKLSLEEFKNYFADGIISSEELSELFSKVDRQHSRNLDTEKLCDYFSEHLGEYKNVLSALEALNISILSAMDKTKVDYESSSKMEQFVSRFLLRETTGQLQSLQGSLECALETIEEQAGLKRPEFKKQEDLRNQRPGKRCGRRAQKSVCVSPTDPLSGMLTTGVTVEAESQWSTQINRLEQLIDKLEDKSPHLDPFKEELVHIPSDSQILVAQRQISVNEDSLEKFRQALQIYTESTANQISCLHISSHKLTKVPCFRVYEFWQDLSSWKSHQQSNYSKTFQRAIINALSSPELVNTMLFPSSWWILNHN